MPIALSKLGENIVDYLEFGTGDIRTGTVRLTNADGERAFKKSQGGNVSKFQATYGISDGYAGGDRPHHFSISSDEIEDDMTDEDLKTLYTDYVQDDFNDKIYPVPRKVDEFVAWAREQINNVKEAI